MKWTSEQQKVIDFRNRNILVSAAAGSGKTAVLVERIIKRITDKEHPVDIDKLLVVTFTNAAAAEMRERIGNAIEKQLEEYPEDENLRKQQTLLHNAQITTIDSFCLFVVRNHFEEIQMDPNFRIADQGELKLLELDVLNEVFEKEYEKQTDAFLQLVDAYSDKRSNKAVKDMVAKIYRQSASNPWPKEWVESLVQPYLVGTKEELLETELMQGILAYVKSILVDMPARLEALREVALSADGPAKYAETIEKDLQGFEGLAEVCDYESLASFCEKAESAFGRLASIRNFTGSDEKKNAVSDGRKAVKDELKELRARYFSMPLDDLVEQLKRMRPMAEELVRLALTYMEAMEEKKAKRHIMDFSDIEHAALRIFVDEKTKEYRATAMDFKKQFEEIMIDEYQDSNQVQEEIMCAISRQSQGEYNMFMVGDVKQSIYRFRLARPELFMEKFARFDLEESKEQRIDLHKNFRSRREVLDFTNDVFYKIMDADLGNVAYDDEAALYYGADYVDAGDKKAEVLLYETSPVQEYGDSGEESGSDELSKKQLEARMIADRILELKEKMEITDKATGVLRPLRNSDIVILLRSLSGWGNEFVSVLEDCGIPAHVSTSTGYFSAMEVQTVLSFLKILDNPYQDIPMAAVLKSAIVGLDNEEMAELSLTEGASSFADAVLMQMEAATDGRLLYFKELYQGLRKKISDTPIHQLLYMVLEETGFGDYVKALPAGAQRKANLDMLIEKAIAYEKTSYKGLFHFIRYIDQLQKYEVDFGEADITGENEDVVRLMTIHKSKGLEFPVVFVSGISKKFNEMDARDKAAIHPDMGLGLDEVQVEPRVKRKCLIRSEITDRIHRDNLGEELRVLYVAMTRAKEKLILTGVVENQEKLYKNHSGNIIKGKSLSFSQRVMAKSYMDWITDAVLSYPDKYAITFVQESDLVLSEAKKRAQIEVEKEALLVKIANAKEGLVQQFKEAFAYEYPYKQDENKKSKYSVSELKHASMVEKYDHMEGGVEVPDFLLEERESYVPEFALDMEMTKSSAKESVEETTRKAPAGVSRGALRGTAVHRVMECLDFKQILEIDTISIDEKRSFVKAEVARMLEMNLITEEMKELVRIDGLIKFVESPVALRMAKADANGDLFREKPFVMDYQGVLVQGIIDVFWLEGERIVLLDYKTDNVQKAEELVLRYKTQLELYADALSRVFSTKDRIIKETENLIYSFKLDQVILVTE
ncbi:MAG: helicase-exonuclease AddAB subunit AddA [Agathobacter sp.]|nr:helicase-exonuclease AddAB subunit AddA [Agathobacter sp.]